jgi:hypothetical protein
MAGQAIDIEKPAAAPETEKTYPASLGYEILVNIQRHKNLIQVQRREVKDVIDGKALALAQPSSDISNYCCCI